MPYRGAQASTQDLLGGRIESMFDSLPSAAPHIRSGVVRAIAVSGPERSPTFPDIPTMAEQGYPQLISTNWFGIAGPAAVPEPIVTKLHAEIVKALATPSVKERLTNIGVEAGRRYAGRHAGLRARRDRALGQGGEGHRHHDQLRTAPA